MNPGEAAREQEARGESMCLLCLLCLQCLRHALKPNRDVDIRLGSILSAAPGYGGAGLREIPGGSAPGQEGEDRKRVCIHRGPVTANGGGQSFPSPETEDGNTFGVVCGGDDGIGQIAPAPAKSWHAGLALTLEGKELRKPAERLRLPSFVANTQNDVG